MSKFSRTLRTARGVALGLAFTVTASIAAAAIVILLPESPVRTEAGSAKAGNMNEYVLLHQARNAVVPNYMRIDIEPLAQ